MSIKSILSAIIVEDDPASKSAADYAVSLAAGLNAHLTAMVGTPRITAPGGLIISQVRTLMNSANAERRKRAEETLAALKSTARGEFFSGEIVHDIYLAVRARMVEAARMSDLIVVSPSGELMTSRYDFMRALIFTSGRPVLLAPDDWTKPAAWKKIAVAWDGGAPAARALGDAMPLIEMADETEVVCVTPDKDKSTGGAALAAHLARHCRSVRLNEMPVRDGDVGKTIREHAAATHADLIVMGAFGHSRLWELTLGGATQDAIENIQTPTMLSH